MKQTDYKKKRSRKKKTGRFKMILPYVAIILVAACLIIAVIFVTGRQGINDRTNPSAVELDRQSQSSDETNRMETDMDPRIADLVTRYFQAVKIADAEGLKKIVVSDNPVSEQSLQYESQFIEGYSNISCHTIAGIVDKTYIVYISYDTKFLNIDTRVPSLIRFYICENEDGSMYINFRKQDGEVLTYMQEIASWQEVRDLVTKVNVQAQEAYESDAKLKAFKDMLDGTATTQASEQSSEQTTSDAAENITDASSAEAAQ